MTIFLAATHALQARKWTPDEVRDVIRKVNTYWQENNKAEVRSFWDNAAYHTGNMEVYKLLKDEHLLDYSVRWAEHNRWMGAQEPDASKWKYKTYGEGQDYVLFGDWQICFQTYIDLYLLEERGERREERNERREERIARAKEVMGYEADSRAHDYWWWADALYMVMPVMTKMYRLTGDEKYLDKLYENLLYSDSIMLDEEAGLYFRDGKYVYPKHKSANGKKDFWARGDGWVLAGLAKVLQESDSRFSYISSHAWPVQWQNASNHKATGPAPCSMQNMRLDLKPAERLSSATACCGVSITDAWTRRSLHLSSSGHGNTSQRPPCSRAARWVMCSPSASGPSPDRRWMPIVRLTLLCDYELCIKH